MTADVFESVAAFLLERLLILQTRQCIKTPTRILQMSFMKIVLLLFGITVM